jgi:hypothetical protein
MREGESEWGSGVSSGRGRGGCELDARRGRRVLGVRVAREGGYARTRELTEGAHKQRERGSGRTRRGSGSADRAGPPGQREEEGAGARALGWLGRKAEGRGGCGPLYLFLLFRKLFPFSFYLLHLTQFQICHNFKLAPSSICIKQNWSLGFNMMQHFILPWSLAY